MGVVRQSNRIVRVSLATLVLVGVAACDGDGPLTQPTPTVTALRISGPSSLTPNALGNFTLVADYSDGRSVDVTATATWTSSNSSVVRFDAPGRATAPARGESLVSATFSSVVSSQLSVMVLETGTYRLTGTVTSAAGVRQGGMTIMVVPGTGAGLQTLTDLNGRYALYGVSGTIQLRVVSDGFELATQIAVVNEHAVVDVTLF